MIFKLIPPVPVLEKEMATRSSILAWKIPWTEEPGRLQSMESQSRTRLNDFIPVPGECGKGPGETMTSRWKLEPPFLFQGSSSLFLMFHILNPALQADSLPTELSGKIKLKLGNG